MKKFMRAASLFMAAAMTLSLASCGSSSANSAEETQAKAEEVQETEAKQEETEAEKEDASSLKFGFIFLHDENSTYDRNFINGAKEACEELGVEYVFKTNIPEGQECYDAACDLADTGCNIIFADSFGHEDYLLEAAKEYPEIEFCHATGTKAHTENLSNFHNAFASIYEGRYLAGITAGLKLNEMIADGTITEDQAKIGYVGAYTYAEVISGYTSFFLGARSVCPSATMEVTFTGSWYDETAEKEGANKLINDGCVLVSQHADSMGAPTACEDAGVPNVSYNGSTVSACPNTFLVSSRINWAPYFKYVIDCVSKGESIAPDYTGTLDTDSVCLTEFGPNVAEGTEDAVNTAMEAMKAGSLHVFDTESFTVNGEKLTSYMADVDTDANYEPDHEAISDGYFNESADGLRSAPYFDIQIDGISLMDTAF